MVSAFPTLSRLCAVAEHPVKDKRRQFRWGVGRVSAVTVSPDGCRAAVGDTTGAVGWDIE